MRLDDLQYEYPERLIATERRPQSRVAFVDLPGPAVEISKAELLARFAPGEVVVINDTRVENRRVFAGDREILFVAPLAEGEWEVLFPSREVSVGDEVELPGGVRMTLVAKGLPQKVRLSKPLNEAYFQEYGEPALPPYIQKARGVRHARTEDRSWYQTKWAKEPGSSAAPTASLHFDLDDLEILKQRGVQVCTLTLHVGLGTFLPIKVSDLSEHKMHHEAVHIPAQTLRAIEAARGKGERVWALGTTVARALEGWAAGHLTSNDSGSAFGSTDLFIKPGFEFRVIRGLMTNFHQPGSTLLALVAAFAGLEKVHEVYRWAIEKNFRLFSYGDLSVWRRP